MLKKILSPFVHALTPQISYVKTVGGGGGSRPAKKALESVAAAKKRREAIAKAKAEKLQRDFARRQKTKALSR